MIAEDRFHQIISKFKDLKPVIVLGDVGIDKYTQGEVNRISPEAPVPVLEVNKEWYKLGLAANISHNLKTLEIASTLVGVTGSDRNASMMENLLEENDLKTWGLIRSDERPTIFKERVTTATQQICRIDYEKCGAVSEDLASKLVERTKDFLEGHEAVIIEDYGKGTLTKEVIEKVIKSAKEKNQLVLVDPSRTTDPNFYKGASLLKPNRIEALKIAEALGHHQEKDFQTIAEIIKDKLEIDRVVITLGKDGMAMLGESKDEPYRVIPTAATEVFDVSGAGDTAISLLTVALVAGATLEEAAWIGNCGSGVVVGKTGTATVNQQELTSFYQNLRSKLQ